MSLRLSTSFVNTNVPGAYIDVRVKSTPVGVGASGNIAIIGEAAGGADYAAENLKENFFTPDQAASVAQKYISGPVVDAMNALASPSNDSEIQGSANRVYILKTNAGSKAQATVDTDYGTLRDQNYGSDGNKYSYKILASAAEVAPAVTSDDLTTNLGTPTLFDGLNFSVRLNGGAIAAITLSGVAANHDTIAELAAEIDAALPAGISCAVATGNTLTISVDADAAAWRKGFGKSLELIDSTPGDLAVLGLDPGLIASSQEPEVEVNIIRPDTNTNESIEAKAEVALNIGYAGTTATATVNATQLTTTVTGGSGANLTILLSQYSTLQAMADFINSQTGYSASVEASSIQSPTSALDRVSAIGICSTAASLKPGRIKKAMSNFKSAMATSQVLEFVQTDFDGLPTPMANFAFLAGGARGATTASDIVDALTALEGVSVNFVIPLMSRDATADIADGLTNASSTYTIDAIHAAVKSHALKMSAVKLKKNRISMLSYKGTYSASKTKAGSLASFRATMTMQDAKQVNSQGAIVQYQPWYQSVIAAGMQSAGFYKSIVKRFANVISFVDPSGFDSGSPGDVSDALDSGILFMENANAGVRWVSDQTTYGFDTNFVYNSLQAVYLSDVLSLDLAESLGNAFTGKSLADVDAGVVLSFVTTKMDGYKKLKMIASSDDAPLGYKNVTIEIDGPVLSVALEAKLATSIYFIPIVLELSQVQSSAAQ
jgi:hypothetical protein